MLCPLSLPCVAKMFVALPQALRMKAPKSIIALLAIILNSSTVIYTLVRILQWLSVMVGEGKRTKRMSCGTRVDARHNGRFVLEHPLCLECDPVALEGTVLGVILDRQRGTELFKALDEGAVRVLVEFG